MGIDDFYKLLKRFSDYNGKWKNASKLIGKKIAVDASMQIVIAKTKKYNSGLIPHFTKLLDFFAENSMYAVFVFDDRKHQCPLKKQTHIKRSKQKQRNIEKLNEVSKKFKVLARNGKKFKQIIKKYISTESNIVNTILSYTCDTQKYLNFKSEIQRRKKSILGTVWTEKDIDLLKNLISEYNFASINTPYHEAEHLCSRLSELNMVDYILTKDSDIFMMGGKKLIYTLDISRRSFKVFKTKKILEGLKLNMKQLVNLSFLLGNDFVHRIRGNGIVTSYKLIVNAKNNGHELINKLYDNKLIRSVRSEISYKFPKEVEFIKHKYIEYIQSL